MSFKTFLLAATAAVALLGAAIIGVPTSVHPAGEVSLFKAPAR